LSWGKKKVLSLLYQQLRSFVVSRKQNGSIMHSDESWAQAKLGGDVVPLAVVPLAVVPLAVVPLAVVPLVMVPLAAVPPAVVPSVGVPLVVLPLAVVLVETPASSSIFVL
jgi:hypothetical protein